MKAIPGEVTYINGPVPTATRLGIPMITHGMPAVLIGGVIGVMFVSHALHQVWEAFPILLSALGLVIATIWLVTLCERSMLSIGEKIDEDSVGFGISLVAAVVIFFVSLIGTYNSWQGAHPSTLVNQKPLNCKSDGGVSPGWPKEIQVGSYTHVRVVCRDGYGFDQDN